MELYQRIEQLIDKKLPVYPTVEEEVMGLMERVSEAQRYARMVSWADWLSAAGIYRQICNRGWVSEYV